jgi:hypothetical protein
LQKSILHEKFTSRFRQQGISFLPYRLKQIYRDFASLSVDKNRFSVLNIAYDLIKFEIHLFKNVLDTFSTNLRTIF